MSSRGVGEGAESEELTVSKGGNVILSGERIEVRPKMYRSFINTVHKGSGLHGVTCGCVMLQRCVFLTWRI